MANISQQQQQQCFSNDDDEQYNNLCDDGDENYENDGDDQQDDDDDDQNNGNDNYDEDDEENDQDDNGDHRNQGGNRQHQGDNGGGSNGSSGDNFDGPKYIRLRGLPWSATHKEILDFLKNVNVSNGSQGIFLVTSRWDGKNTGEAYVEVGTNEDVDEARKLNKGCMGHRYIEVFTATAKEVKEAIRKTGAPGTAYVVKLRGLPYAVTEQQIEEFFSGLEIKADREGILFVMDRRGRATGEAFVQFENQDDTEQALGRNREKIGHRYIEIFRSSLAEMKRATGSGNTRPGPYDIRDRGANRGGNNDFGGGGGGRNGDWGNNNAGVGNFGVGANNMLGFNNLPSLMNSGNFGNSGGGGFGSGGPGFGNGGGGGNFGGNNGNFGNGPNFGGNGGGGGGGSNPNFGGGNGNNNGGGNFGNFGGNGGGGFGGAGNSRFGNNNGGNNGNFGNDFGDFNNFGNDRNFGGGNNGNFGPGGGGGGGNGPNFGGNGGGGGNGGPNFGNFGGGGNFGNFGGNGFNGGGNFGNGGNFGPIGGGRNNDVEYYVIHMRGLPYSSFENDVFKFFEPLRPANVRINFNKKGLHSGTADVFFETHDDSQVAMKRQCGKMGSRYIELFYDGKARAGGNGNERPMGGGMSGGNNFARRI